MHGGWAGPLRNIQEILRRSACKHFEKDLWWLIICGSLRVFCERPSDWIQVVGRHHDDWGVLQLGYAFEQATDIGKRRPDGARRIVPN